MNYYNISLLSSPLNPLTYSSKQQVAIGVVVKVKTRNKSFYGVVQSKVPKPDQFECLEIDEATTSFYDAKQLQLAKFISSYYFSSLGEALGVMVPFEPQTLVTHKPKEPNIELSTKQQEAVLWIDKHDTTLLFGDTGSGKSEIYAKYFAKMLKDAKSSIFLMPEISLTPQMQKRLEAHFGSSVVMWHSKLTPKERNLALEKIRSTTPLIVAGPRSALFLPLQNLGFIVVDEEHDDSYKSSSRPRYNAKDMAIYMGKLYGAKVVLGSATPTITSYEKYPHFRLKGNYHQSRKEFIYEHSKESISPLILEKIAATLEKKEQCIIFLPTRANFKYLICKECQHAQKCAFCSVGMSLHHKTNSLRCHYCNFSQAIPKLCAECGGENLESSRMGTAEVVNELRMHFGNATVEQFDRDVITTHKKLSNALKKFNNKEIDILVGTQMLSKGHDYHAVSLAVVLGLDNILLSSDHRARERALSTLLQVAGRSGRKDDAVVVVQTLNREFFSHYIDDYELFLKDEMKHKQGLYPPFKRLCRVLFANKNGIKAQEDMHKMVDGLKLFSEVEIVGYGKCAIERVADKYRFEILLRADNSRQIIRALRVCSMGAAEIDMDPVEFS